MIIRGAKRVQGQISVPGDKSISHRAAMMAQSEKPQRNPLDGAADVAELDVLADPEAVAGCSRFIKTIKSICKTLRTICHEGASGHPRVLMVCP